MCKVVRENSDESSGGKFGVDDVLYVSCFG